MVLLPVCLSHHEEEGLPPSSGMDWESQEVGGRACLHGLGGQNGGFLLCL